MPRTINLSEIIVKPNRQRQEFEAEKMQELCDSIEKTQLMHAPVLRREGSSMILVAGERRLRAMTQIFELGGSFYHDGHVYADGEIPYTDIGELDEIDAEEAELDENLRRADLTWQEHAAAVERLHNLRIRQKPRYVMEVTTGVMGVSEQKNTIVSGGHSVADTAKELLGRSDGQYQETIRQEIIIAKHLDNPLIAKAGSAKEAFKILKAEEERKKNQELAKVVGKTFSSAVHDVIHGDCLQIMTQIANGPESHKFDVLLCDPPYGMGADQFGDGGGKMTAIEHHYDDSLESWMRLMEAFAPLSYNVAKAQAHAYLFCDIGNFDQLKDYMQSAGWYVFRTPFIVVKRNSGRVPLPDRGPRRQWECLLYAIKGSKPVTHIYPDVIEASADEQLGHGAQKPVSVYQNLLQRSVRPGDRVADFFAGTGPILPAAHGMQCYATAVEQDGANYAKCVQRLQQLQALEQDSLPGLN